MAGSLNGVDLSQIPAPPVVEVIDYEVILSGYLADLQARTLAAGLQFTALVESDPAYKQLEVIAYREFMLRQRVNDAARAVMTAYAVDGDLDNLGALVGVTRLTLDPGDPTKGIAPTMESNDDYRRRIVLAPEGFSVAGPVGAYVYHALSADPDVLDASATSPEPDDIRAIVSDVLAKHDAADELIADMNAALDAATWPGEVIVTVLARTADGTAPDELVQKVSDAVNAEDVRPMTDHVTTRSAEIVRYKTKATVYTYTGPDSSVVMADAMKRLKTYQAAVHKLGMDVAMSGLAGALHTAGVQRVEFDEPLQDIVIGDTQASYCDPDNDIEIVYGGTDE
jgi:phage-related baseplate assembly protein